LATFDVCRFPSLRKNTIIPSFRGRGRYTEPSVRPTTLQEYVSAQLRSLEAGYKEDIWRNWLESYNGTTLDPAEGERREQIFFDDFFDETETFFNQTVPQLCDKVKGFVQKTRRTGDTSIGDFVMSHLLPVQMDTIVKFVKFLRCSWTSDPPRYGNIERTISRLINEYNPQTLFGLDGLDIGTDADIIQKNLLNQLNVAADQLKDLAFKPLSTEIPREEMTIDIWHETTSIYGYVKDLRKFFNSHNLPKAVSTAKKMIARMMGGEEPQLENLLLTILAKAQEEEFWEKLDEVAANLCKQRNNWLDENLFSALLDLIDEIVVGQRPYDYNEPMSMANNTNSTSYRLDVNHYLEEKLPLVFFRLKYHLLLDNFFTSNGQTCFNSKCHAHGIPGFRIAVQTLVPIELDRLYNEPDIEASPQNSQLPQPRYTIRNALGLDFLGPYFDNTKFFFGGLIVQALHFTGFVDF